MRDRPFLTRHALDQMARRNITHEEVEEVLDGPNVVEKSTRTPRARKVWKNVKGRRITLVIGPSKM